MGKFNAAMQSMTWEEDYLNANAGSPVDGTWYEVANYSGQGRLFAVGIATPTIPTTGELRITADGNAHTIAKASLAEVIAMHSSYSSNDRGILPYSLEFDTSLVVDIRRDGDTNAVKGWASYGILSQEYKREIITAGDPIPDRTGNPRKNPDGSIKTYDHDIMLVWFCHGKDAKGVPYGISNAVKHLPGDRVETSIAADGTVTGQLRKAAYNTTVNGPRVTWSDDNSDTEKVISFDGERYKVPIKAGQIDNQFLPKANVKKVKDATKALQ